MKKEFIHKIKKLLTNIKFLIIVGLLVLLTVLFYANIGFGGGTKISYEKNNNTIPVLLNSTPNLVKGNTEPSPILVPLDKVAYDLKLKELANIKVVVPKVATTTVINPKTKIKTVVPVKPIVPVVKKPDLWPVKAVYPNSGALLPFNRIVAYYGNFYSKKMGALGAYPEDEMLQKLSAEVAKWNLADPNTPAIPALHYIAVTAQGSPGGDGKYRLRMPSSQIDEAIRMAAKINAIVFLDVQVGFSNLQTEIPLLEKYLKMPQVHLGIDPEFSMKTGVRPGKVVGTLDANDINFAADYLAKIVKENNLSPKILVVHRYTQKMVTNYNKITPLPEVQVVMDMDGWGVSAKKINTYQQFIYKEPVQFTGFKLFYKNDILTPNTAMMTPTEVMKLSPEPSYIQYQ